jgi:hypothetical protein
MRRKIRRGRKRRTKSCSRRMRRRRRRRRRRTRTIRGIIIIIIIIIGGRDISVGRNFGIVMTRSGSGIVLLTIQTIPQRST